MSAVNVQMGQFVTIFILAIALGMDAFSLGIGLGLKGVRLSDILRISAVIAVFHIIMPLMGMFAGHYASTLLGSVAAVTGGGLLIILGGHMIYSSLRGEAASSFDHRSAWGLTIFSLMVSIDSFSVGISMGLFASDMVLTILLFGVVGGIMSVLGLLLGRKIGYWVGEYGEAFGGIILLAFGIKFLM